MTPLEGFLLLAGLFGLPLILLVKTQRFRDLGRRMRGAFWGGVIGYFIGIFAWCAVLILPTVMWDSGSARLAGVVLPLLLCGVAGIGVGALIGKEPRKRAHRKRKPRARVRTGAASDRSATASSGPSSSARETPAQ